LEYLQQEDAESWLVAFHAADDRVGTVAVSALDPGVATITFIGVVPEHRGHGYRHDLLRAATSAAHGRGFEEILSDVDTLNQPMIDTMRNAGHLDGVRPCHIWHYRGEVATFLDG
jgi:ribosomal protein S18 acetylase RimI-like enzyme